MDEHEIQSTVEEMSRQIARDHNDLDRLLILGIRTKGSFLAQRIATELERQQKRKPEVGEIEIYGSGDELRRLSPNEPEATTINLGIGRSFWLTMSSTPGEPSKARLTIIFRSGRPQSVRLAVLIDRGHREVPVRPNYVGKNIPSSERERVRVKLREAEHDEKDKVVIYSIISPTETVEWKARMTRKTAILALADGRYYQGLSFGAEGEAVGEVVFNTSMTGYQEILTDPSYEGQLVAMTYPQIGNVGVNAEDVESRQPFMKGFIVKEYTFQPSNWRSNEPLHEYMKRHGIVGIEGIDTRSLVRHLRDHGSQEAIISTVEQLILTRSLPKQKLRPDLSDAIWCAT